MKSLYQWSVSQAPSMLLLYIPGCCFILQDLTQPYDCIHARMKRKAPWLPFTGTTWLPFMGTTRQPSVSLLLIYIQVGPSDTSLN